MKSIEDINLDRGQKVGTYVRAAAPGFIASGGNPIAAVVTMIVAQPTVAVPILRAYGKVAGSIGDLSESIISKMKAGKSLLPNERTFFVRAVKQFGPGLLNAAGTINAQVPNKK